ncbi:hypothetical protein H4R18_005491, partial [Coemansia javaensis]
DIGYHHPGISHCPTKPEYAARCDCPANRTNYMLDRSSCRRRFQRLKNLSRKYTLGLIRLGTKQQ